MYRAPSEGEGHQQNQTRCIEPRARLARLAAIAAILSLSGCSGAGQFVNATGTCAVQKSECETRCQRLQDARDCEASCLLQAKLCMRAQGEKGPGIDLTKPARISDYKALIVDLFSDRPRHSPELAVEVTQAQVVDGVHRFAPGGTLSVAFELPADTREAELALTHAPEGDGTGCFITITLGDKTLAGRYAPPRGADGKLKVETWNLTPMLNELGPSEGPRAMRLFIYNNQAAGSTKGYRLGSVQVFYRTLSVRPAESPDTDNRSLSAPR